MENVELSKHEYDKLVLEYTEPTIKTYIEKLSLYIPNKSGKPYKDYAAALRTFLSRDNIKPKVVKPRELCPHCEKVRNNETLCNCGWSYTDNQYLGD